MRDKAYYHGKMITSPKNSVRILTGPTASGKSALALEWAAQENGVIINADAMQMYRDLRILTARPSVGEEAQVPHRLYGVLDAHETGSVAIWLNMAIAEIRQVWAEGKLPILVGGTGMYLKALMEGIAPVPEIPEAVREEVRGSPRGAGELHARLAKHDAKMAARLKPGDTQRILRALEVVLATGKSLAEWQEAIPEKPLPEAEFNLHIRTLPRKELYARIDKRVHLMLEAGALDEVKALKGLNLPPSLPLMRAHGVPEFIRFLNGEMAWEDAIDKTQQNTRNYAKRQETWIRNQFGN